MSGPPRILAGLIAAVSTLAAGGASDARAASAGRRYAVVIGNDHGRAEEAPLRYAERDAAELASTLRRLGGVPAQNLVLVLGERAELIQQALLQVNARIRSEASSSGDASTLLVYYSGHADAEGLHPGPTALSYETLRALVAGSLARARVLIIDGCRSGGLTAVKGGTPVANFELAAGDRGWGVEGLVMISSSAAGEDSHESERLGASFFTHHLIAALMGMGDEDHDQTVTVAEAYGYAYRQTVRASGRTFSLQHPTYAYALKGRGSLVLTWLADQGTSAHLALPDAGTYLIARGDDGPLIAEVHAEVGGARIVLEPAVYFVEQRARDHYRQYRVELRAGEDVDLADRSYRAIEYARLVRKGAEARALVHGVHVLASGRGELLAGLGPMVSVVAGYGLDLPWGSFGLRARYGRSEHSNPEVSLNMTHRELALGLTAQRFFDLPWFSVGLGFLIEGIHHLQAFTGRSVAPERSATNMALGAVVTVDYELAGPLVLRVEGGPLAEVFRLEDRRGGGPETAKTSPSITGWGGLGVGWRF